MTTIHRVHIHEHVIPGKRLGRHVEHDPRSKQHPFGVVMAASQMVSITHRRYGSIFDQLDIGSCTGNAGAGAINTVPLHVLRHRALVEKDAVGIYSLATKLDGFDGEYPPDDTGSSGLAAAQALKQMGLITDYRHAFTLAEALTALQIGPVITGVNWYEGFDNPNPNTGMVAIAGQIRGGHEFLIRGIDVRSKITDSILHCDNSWGLSYGIHGHFKMRVSTWAQLLTEEGDVTILNRDA